jgi:hypothetical protein
MSLLFRKDEFGKDFLGKNKASLFEANHDFNVMLQLF